MIYLSVLIEEVVTDGRGYSPITEGPLYDMRNFYLGQVSFAEEVFPTYTLRLQTRSNADIGPAAIGLADAAKEEWMSRAVGSKDALESKL